MAQEEKSTPRAAAVPPNRAKRAGDTKIVLISDWNERHNGAAVELSMRKIFETKRDFSIIAVRAARAFSVQLLADADLLIANRSAGPDPLDLLAGGTAASSGKDAAFWTDANVRAVLSNVRDRGMGFLALHATMDCGNEDILRLLDYIPVMPGGEPQPVWARNLNPGHPVTRGIGKFHLRLDEQDAGILRSSDTTVLFETSGIHNKRESVGGWCRAAGRGRVVGLLPGHHAEAYEAPEFRAVIWNAAHWALGRETAKFPEAGNTLY